MNRIHTPDRAPAVAVWLASVAALVFIMVVVGGITRLTGSGLSITEWQPIMGAVPPLNDADWAEAFAKYQAIPQYQQVNAGMTLGEFKGIFWWEWIHRQLGRVIGAAFALPFLVFLGLRMVPRRLIWRCALLLALGDHQPPDGLFLDGAVPDAHEDLAQPVLGRALRVDRQSLAQPRAVLALGHDRCDERVLRVEVVVDRRDLDAARGCELPHRRAGSTLLAHELEGGVEDAFTQIRRDVGSYCNHRSNVALTERSFKSGMFTSGQGPGASDQGVI
jgi:hypothetical protein